MTVGEKLSKLRKEYNYTQEQLADILGVSRQSQQEKCSLVGDTDSLLHIVGDNDDGVILFQLHGQVLNSGGRNGVKGRGGFIHQQNLWFYCQCTGDAKPLLLTAGHT